MPNEWIFEPFAGGGIAIRHDDGRLIAIVYEEPYAPQIAATPDLYDALKALDDHGLDEDQLYYLIDQDVVKQVRAALAKARGESPAMASAPTSPDRKPTEGEPTVTTPDHPHFDQTIRADLQELLARECHEGGGTRVTNCVLHSHKAFDDRPYECRLCSVDIQNHLRVAVAINEWLNQWKDDATALLSERALLYSPTSKGEDGGPNAS